jgi:hypothetical protein
VLLSTFGLVVVDLVKYLQGSTKELWHQRWLEKHLFKKNSSFWKSIRLIVSSIRWDVISYWGTRWLKVSHNAISYTSPITLISEVEFTQSLLIWTTWVMIWTEVCLNSLRQNQLENKVSGGLKFIARIKLEKINCLWTNALYIPNQLWTQFINVLTIRKAIWSGLSRRTLGKHSPQCMRYRLLWDHLFLKSTKVIFIFMSMDLAMVCSITRLSVETRMVEDK